jgi:hypothetical protein
LAILGVGPFIAAGPIMAALSGAAIGATAINPAAAFKSQISNLKFQWWAGY